MVYWAYYAHDVKQWKVLHVYKKVTSFVKCIQLLVFSAEVNTSLS